MRLTTKLIFSFIFLLLASSLLVTHGCGKRSGGCPDNVAPYGSTITLVTPLTLVPHNAGGDCYSPVKFVVADSSGPLSDICVEVSTNGLIALQSGPPDCKNINFTKPQTAIVTTTDASGVVSLELLTLPTTTKGGTTIVQVSSGAVAMTPPATTPPAAN